jgi:PAS domain S-box-containing protein
VLEKVRNTTAETDTVAKEEDLAKGRADVESRLEKVAASGPGAIYTYREGKDGTITLPYSSAKIDELFGVGPEVLAKDATVCWKLIHPDDLERVQKSVGESKTTLLPWHSEFRLLHPRKGEIWVEGSSIPEIESDGSVLWAGYMLDVTERRRTLNALQESEQRFRQVFDHASDCIFLLDVIEDNHFKFVGANAANQIVLGKSASEVVGHSIEEVSPDLSAHILANYRRCLTVGETINYEEELNLATGRRNFDTTLIPVRNENNQIYRIIGIARDITQRKRADEALRLLNVSLEERVAERTKALEETNQELQAFSYSVSHDLRAPLRSIDGFSKILLEDYKDKLDDEGKEHLKIVCEASQRMGQLIDHMLMLSRVTLSEIRRETIDVTELAQFVASELQCAYPDRNIDFEIEEGLSVCTDPDLLKIVLENLFGNALKFTGRQGKALIEMGKSESNGVTTYFVRDNGVGFDSKQADKIFAAFHRLHSNDQFPGDGVGLATVQRIIRRLGGKIWGEGKVGQGATFYFTIAS